ncbi:hypothetical protein [Scytonema sp. PCC 10023]|uniref:hypothetical protein n=1 Tax=Scytonema sp. PCC 10023 TaxID=1680591 RepID=UPI0039C6B470
MRVDFLRLSLLVTPLQPIGKVFTNFFLGEGLGTGDWGLGITESLIPNPQSLILMHVNFIHP